MQLLIAAVGHMKQGPKRAVLDEYLARMAWDVTIKEVEEKKKLAAEQLKQREGELLLAAVPKGYKKIVLDEHGKVLSSKAFAALLGDWRDDGEGRVAFLIGGADGHSREVRTQADITLSFGAMTWPHMLVRPMLAEQLFRAQCILSGHPYHRE